MARVAPAIIGFASLVAVAGCAEAAAPTSEANLRAEIEALNKSMPPQPHDKVWLDRLTLERGAVTYNYVVATLDDPAAMDLVIQNFRSDAWKASTTKAFCEGGGGGHAEALGYKTRYRYVTTKGDLVVEQTMSSADCKQ